jgi:hypothetical protein
VKGYETDLDRLKWSQFTEKLIVWKKDELFKLGILGNRSGLGTPAGPAKALER